MHERIGIRQRHISLHETLTHSRRRRLTDLYLSAFYPAFILFHFLSLHFTSLHFIYHPSVPAHLLGMDQAIDSEADPLIPLSSDAEVNKYLVKINDKLKQLKTIGLTKNDHKILEKRLNFVWGELKETDPHASDPDKLKAWRHTRAREIYTNIQDANDHMFLALILVISPSESVKTSFQNVVNYLVHPSNNKPYQLNLSSADKMFFESTSVKQDFTGSRHFLRFIEAVFPQGLFSHFW